MFNDIRKLNECKIKKILTDYFIPLVILTEFNTKRKKVFHLKYCHRMSNYL